MGEGTVVTGVDFLGTNCPGLGITECGSAGLDDGGATIRGKTEFGLETKLKDRNHCRVMGLHPAIN